MKPLCLAALCVAALLAPASAAQAVPKDGNYGHCLKLNALTDLGLSPSEFNAVFNPIDAKGNKPGAPIECLVAL
jgi:opacity protein-like surface antigen